MMVTFFYYLIEILRYAQNDSAQGGMKSNGGRPNGGKGYLVGEEYQPR